MAKNQENGASGTPLLPANGNDAQNLSEMGVDRSAALSDTAAVAAISASLATTLHIAHNIEDEMSMDQGAPAIQEAHDTQDVPAAENGSSSNENRPAADTICEIAGNTNDQRETSAAATDSSSSSTISALPLDQDNTSPLQTALPDDDQPRTASAMPSYTPTTTEPSSSVVPEEEKTDISHQQVVEANDDREPEGIAMEDASLVYATEPVALSTSPSPLDLAMHQDDDNDTMPDTVASPMSLQVDQDSNTDTFVTTPLPPPFSKIDVTTQPAQQQQHALPSPMISSPASPSTSATLSLPGDQPDVLPPQPSSSSTAALQPSKQRQKTKKWETKKKKKSKRNTTSFM
ncbi:hypothetical protein BC940DRAFT_37264 [Gongronella butleri]|nr:hypothetical protein BC940DRAFT_37264 [Gongronella butleri]